MKLRLAILALVWCFAVVAGLWSYRQTSHRRAVERLCGAVDAGDWAGALEYGEDMVGSDFPGLRAAECRARALFATGDPESAVTLLDDLVMRPEPRGWLPEPFFVLALVVKRRAEGRLPEATELIRRGTAQYPDNEELTVMEIRVRCETENEERVLEEVSRRLLDRGQSRSKAGYILVQRAIDRDRLDVAEELLGNEPPVGHPDVVSGWFRLRAHYFSHLGDSAQLARTCREWEEAGGSPAEVLAWEAIYRSSYHIEDPRYPHIPMLRSAIERRYEIADRKLVETVYYRLIGSLAFTGLHDEALEVYDEASREFEFPQGRREEILRSAAQERDGAVRRRRGRLRFELADPTPGATLLVSADPTQPVDTAFEELPMAGGRVEVERTIATAPQRWVLREGDAVLASGAAWPTEDRLQEVRIVVTSDPVASNQSLPLPSQPAADGRRRVILVILDGADWRLVQYLRARAELPVLDSLVRLGRRAVLESRPPFTAAALNALVFPSKDPALSTLGALNRLGAELAGNSFVSQNPLAVLGWVLPQNRSVFESLGSGEHVTVNFLHAVANMEAGEHGAQIGPHGEVGRFTNWRLRRPLEPGEVPITRVELDRRGYGDALWQWFEEVAAVFDASYELAETREVDLAMIRVASLDLASHRSFGDFSRATQDDGAYPIYTLYRYMDRRLGELYARLDSDDVLVVMSDHGIENSAEHDPRCFFVAAGGEVEAGRVPGMPHLRGVARMLAELLEVETDWPETGIGNWVSELTEAY